jgi:integrase/recombinase XerC
VAAIHQLVVVVRASVIRTILRATPATPTCVFHEREQYPMPATTGTTDRVAEYVAWLGRQPLAERTRQCYTASVRQYCRWLDALPGGYGDPLADPRARDVAVLDYKMYLKMVRRLAPGSVNAALAAIDRFYRCLGLDYLQVPREDPSVEAPRVLTADDQRRLLQAADRIPNLRSRAMVLLLFHAGLRVIECVAVDLDDVRLSAGRAVVVVRSSAGGVGRQLPLPADAQAALEAWRADRAGRFPAANEPALFVNQVGRRVSAQLVEQAVRQLGHDVGLDLSPRDLRQAFVVDLIQTGVDVRLVTKLAGYRSLETIMRYERVSAGGRATALGELD